MNAKQLSEAKVPELVEGPTYNDGASTGSATCFNCTTE